VHFIEVESLENLPYNKEKDQTKLHFIEGGKPKALLLSFVPSADKLKTDSFDRFSPVCHAY